MEPRGSVRSRGLIASTGGGGRGGCGPGSPPGGRVTPSRALATRDPEAETAAHVYHPARGRVTWKEPLFSHETTNQPRDERGPVVKRAARRKTGNGTHVVDEERAVGVDPQVGVVVGHARGGVAAGQEELVVVLPTPDHERGRRPLHQALEGRRAPRGHLRVPGADHEHRRRCKEKTISLVSPGAKDANWRGSHDDQRGLWPGQMLDPSGGEPTRVRTLTLSLTSQLVAIKPRRWRTPDAVVNIKVRLSIHKHILHARSETRDKWPFYPLNPPPKGPLKKGVPLTTKCRKRISNLLFLLNLKHF